MLIYSIIITIAAVIFAISALKWKIATRTMIMFCKNKFREPTAEETVECSKQVIRRMFKKGG